MSPPADPPSPAPMTILRGTPASPGVVIARAVVLDPEEYRISRPTIGREDVAAELAALAAAFEGSIRDMEAERRQIAEKLGSDTAAIFDWHIGILAGDRIRSEVEELIRGKQFSAPHAVQTVMHDYLQRFRNLRDSVFASRDRDVQDVSRRLLRHLLGESQQRLSDLTERVAVVAHDLTPSQTAQLDPQVAVAVATDLGGSTSHTAIIAHSLGIPAVVGLKTVSSTVATGELLVVDGFHGVVVVNPDPPTLERARTDAEAFAVFERGLSSIRELPAETRDHVRVELLANIEFPHEAGMVADRGGDGVGLYRTEFLFIGSGGVSEAEHYEAYRQAGEALGGRVLTIRSIDVGADKYAPSNGELIERNPFLGLRSIRYCLQNLPMFKAQLRAVLRAAAEHNIRLMFPLVTSLMELRQAKMVLGEAVEDLEEAGLPFRRNIPLGIMIETPAAALECEAFAREVDFVSIGTNDLVQYTLAVDRANERVAPLYTASHPAVLKLIHSVIKTASKSGIGCSVCGEMASEPIYTMLLLGMGLRTFSVPAGDIPEIKKLIRSTTIRHAERIARRALRFETDRQVSSYLREETRKIMPEVV